LRASAGKSSFRREGRLQSLLEQAQTQVAALKAQREAPASTDGNARRSAARERASRERLARVNQALEALEEVKKVKARARDNQRDKRSEPLREQVQERTGSTVEDHLMDGGFVKLEQIERAEKAGVKVYAPPQQSGKDADPYRVRETDSPEVAAWRTRMGSDPATAIYKDRASTSETVNADLRTYRGLGPFLVRGLGKVRCVVLWSALAYNLMHFGRVLLSQ